MKSNKNGFTLVELLAVIVILAIILVIAVPKVMSVIEDAKKATLESTAEMIASQAEKQKVQNTVLGKEDAITCDSVAKINDIDYANCSIEFDGNTAKVTINGKNKFEGLNVCSGTKTNATAQKEGCIVSALTVNLDGGTDNNTQYKEKYDAGSTITLTVPTKEYYEFKEWIIVSGTDASVEGNTLTIGKTDTEVKAVWEDLRTYVDFKVTSSNRHKVGYTGEADEVLNIPATFYDEDAGVWYKVISIDSFAFNNCRNLTSVVIPNTVTSIGDSAFQSAGLTSVTIPNSVTSIGSNPFNACNSITSFTVDPDNAAYSSIDGVLFNKNATKLLKYPAQKEDTSYTIPNSVTSISDRAFGNKMLTSIIIPEGVTSIGQYAFSGCSGLTSINIPDGVTSIETGTFRGCSQLKEVKLGAKIKKIGDYAFYECSNLTSINIPDGVTSIGEYVFYNCKSITSINIPDGVTSIGEFAFYDCKSITSINIPDGVSSIRERTFSGCSGLTSITIPDSVTSIGESAFSQCSSLTSVNILGGVTSIEKSAFSFCKSLTSINIPDGVTSIGQYAFWSCSGLTSIAIPHSVTSIQDSAFWSCESLKDVYYSGTAEKWNSIAIGSSNNTSLLNATIHYNSTGLD